MATNPYASQYQNQYQSQYSNPYISQYQAPSILQRLGIKSLFQRQQPESLSGFNLRKMPKDDYETYDLSGFGLRKMPKQDPLPTANETPTVNAPDETTPFMDQYLALIRNPPKKEPSTKGQKIQAMIAGGLSGYASGPEAGVAMAEHVLGRRYKESMADYETRLKAAGLGADVEYKQAAAKAAARKEAWERGIKEREIANTERSTTSTINLNNANIDRIETEVARGRYIKHGVSDTGNELYFDADTKRIIEFDVGNMSWQEKENAKARIAKAAATYQSILDINRDAAKPGTTKELSPDDRGKIRASNIMKIYKDEALYERWGMFIEYDEKNNSFKIRSPRDVNFKEAGRLNKNSPEWQTLLDEFDLFREAVDQPDISLIPTAKSPRVQPIPTPPPAPTDRTPSTGPASAVSTPEVESTGAVTIPRPGDTKSQTDLRRKAINALLDEQPNTKFTEADIQSKITEFAIAEANAGIMAPADVDVPVSPRFMHGLTGKKPIEPTQPETSQQATPQQGIPKTEAEAVAFLKKNNYPATPENIKKVMNPDNWK